MCFQSQCDSIVSIVHLSIHNAFQAKHYKHSKTSRASRLIQVERSNASINLSILNQAFFASQLLSGMRLLKVETLLSLVH